MDPKERRRQIRHDLRRWGGVARFCRNKQTEITEIRAMLAGAVSLRSPSLDGMPHGTVTTNPTERNAEMLARLEQCYSERIDELTAAIADELQFQHQIDFYVDKLTPDQQMVVRLRYKERLSHERIASQLHFSCRRIGQLEFEACESIARMIA